jgi:excisionase family DNA binding protein
MGMDGMAENRLLKVMEVLPLIGLSRSKVYEMTRTGELPTVRIGRSVRVPTAGLMAWIERNTLGPAQ